MGLLPHEPSWKFGFPKDDGGTFPFVKNI